MFHNDTTKMLQDLEMKFNWAEFDRKMAYFNHIDVILPYERDGVDYTEIHSGANIYISPLPYHLLKEILLNHII